MIVNSGGWQTADFAAGRRVRAFSGIEKAARLKLDRLEAAAALQDPAVLPGNRFEALQGDRRGVQHPNQRPKAGLLRMAQGVSRPREC